MYQYQLEIATDINFDNKVSPYNPFTTEDTNIIVTGLNFGTTYYVRARIQNDGGFSAWSDTETITTLSGLFLYLVNEGVNSQLIDNTENNNDGFILSSNENALFEYLLQEGTVTNNLQDSSINNNDGEIIVTTPTETMIFEYLLQEGIETNILQDNSSIDNDGEINP